MPADCSLAEPPRMCGPYSSRCVQRQLFLPALLALPTYTSPVAEDLEFQDDKVIHHQVAGRRRYHRIGEDILPLGEDRGRGYSQNQRSYPLVTRVMSTSGSVLPHYAARPRLPHHTTSRRPVWEDAHHVRAPVIPFSSRYGEFFHRNFCQCAAGKQVWA